MGIGSCSGIRRWSRGDAGLPFGYVERRAAVPIAALRGPSTPAVDTVPVEPLDLDGQAMPGRPLVLWPVGPDGDAAGAPAEALVVRRDGGRDVAVELRDAAVPGATAPLYSGTLARRETPAWVWALVPVTLVGDAVGTPVLAFFAPAFLVAGD